MSLTKGLAVAAAVMVSSTGLVALTPAEPSAAATGGCGDRAHGVHTSDRRPFNAWACWIDNGDKIRVCDNSPGNDYHAHAELWLNIVGSTAIATEDDGPDRGCDTIVIDGGDHLPGGVYDVILAVWEQHGNTQEPRNYKEIRWVETE